MKIQPHSYKHNKTGNVAVPDTISMNIHQHPDKPNKTGNVAVPDTISMNIQPTLLQTQQNGECSRPGYHLHEDTTNTPTNTTKTWNVAVSDTISMKIQPTLLQTEQNRECSCPRYHLREDSSCNKYHRNVTKVCLGHGHFFIFWSPLGGTFSLKLVIFHKKKKSALF